MFKSAKDYFVEDFARELSKFDELLLLDIYPARELPIEGVTSKWLLDKIELEKKELVQKINLVDKIKESSAKVIKPCRVSVQSP